MSDLLAKMTAVLAEAAEPVTRMVVPGTRAAKAARTRTVVADLPADDVLAANAALLGGDAAVCIGTDASGRPILLRLCEARQYSADGRRIATIYAALSLSTATDPRYRFADGRCAIDRVTVRTVPTIPTDGGKRGAYAERPGVVALILPDGSVTRYAMHDAKGTGRTFVTDEAAIADLAGTLLSFRCHVRPSADGWTVSARVFAGGVMPTTDAVLLGQAAVAAKAVDALADAADGAATTSVGAVYAEAVAKAEATKAKRAAGKYAKAAGK